MSGLRASRLNDNPSAMSRTQMIGWMGSRVIVTYLALLASCSDASGPRAPVGSKLLIANIGSDSWGAFQRDRNTGRCGQQSCHKRWCGRDSDTDAADGNGYAGRHNEWNHPCGSECGDDISGDLFRSRSRSDVGCNREWIRQRRQRPVRGEQCVYRIGPCVRCPGTGGRLLQLHEHGKLFCEPERYLDYRRSPEFEPYRTRSERRLWIVIAVDALRLAEQRVHLRRL